MYLTSQWIQNVQHDKCKNILYLGLMCLKNDCRIFVFLPTISCRGAHTSIVSFIHTFMTQWYSNDEHGCVNLSQPFLTAASFHCETVWGHDFTILAVAAEAVQSSALTNTYNILFYHNFLFHNYTLNTLYFFYSFIIYWN